MKRGSVIIICLVLVSILSISVVSASLLTDIRDFFQNLFNTGENENLGGELEAGKPTCTDSDKGLNYSVYGTCTYSKGTISDSCVVGGTYNGQLSESYCQQNNCYTKYYNCASEGKICSGGKCITSCTPESNATFCTRLGKNCGNVTANDNCGTSRTVNCGTCSSGYYCNSTGKCVLNPTCTAGWKCKDSSNTAYQLSNCSWINVTNCLYGCNSSTGKCNSATCTNECSTSGSKRCSGSYSQTCGNYDADTCLEWSSLTNCLYGCNITNGNCNTCTPKTCLQLGKNCGSWDNGCGTNLSCGPTSKSCTATFGNCSVLGIQTCISGNYGSCMATDPRIANCAGKQCGSNGCGGSCGDCDVLYPGEGKVCNANGICVASCTNDAGCTSVGIKICEGNGYKICDNYDADTCLEFSNVTNCLAKEICEGGICVLDVTFGLVSHWKFDGNANDERGVNNGTLKNGAKIINDANRGQVLSLDGVDDYVSTTDTNAIDGVSTMTVSFWQEANAFGDWDTFISKTIDSTNRWQISLSGAGYGGNDDIVLSVGNGQNSYGYTNENLINLGTWNHIVMVFDGTETGNLYKLKLYFNGAQKVLTWGSGVTIPSLTPSNNAIVQIGAETVFPGRYFNGTIDDVMIFNRSLSADEILNIYNNQKQLNLNISLATLKDNYAIGEQINLTDPPEENSFVVSDAYEKNRSELPKYFSNEIIIKYKENPQIQVRSRIYRFLMGKPKIDTKFESVNELNKEFEIDGDEEIFDEKSGKLANMHKIRLKKEKIEEAVKKYNSDPNVEYAEPNHIYYTNFIPNDPMFNEQWAHKATEAEEIWNITKGNSQVVIAILDTGVDYNHEDLKDSMLADCSNGCPPGTGYDFVEVLDIPPEFQEDGEDYLVEDNSPMDFNGHGTHCAGIAAASANNLKGIAGVCPNCKIMPIRAGFSLKGGGYLEDDDVIQGIKYAADNGAEIISMSFGGSYNYSIEDAINYAYSKGVVLIAAAGNDNSNSTLDAYPAALPNVFAVGSFSQGEAKSIFSNYGSWVDAFAPGDFILSTYASRFDKYAYLSGTSMATPYVAGSAGLVLSRYPSLNVEQVYLKLREISNPSTQNIELYRLTKEINIPSLGYISNNEKTPVESNIDIIGGTGGNNFKLFYGKGYYPNSWILINSGNSLQGLLGVFNVSNLDAGIYTILLRTYKEDYKSDSKINVLYTKGNYPKNTEIPLTIGDKNSGYPLISRDYIAYRTDRNQRDDYDVYDIYYLDLSRKKEFTVISAPYTQWLSSVSENNVIWKDWGDDNHYSYNFATSQTRNLGKLGIVCDLSGGYIACTYYQGSSYEIRIYNFSTLQLLTTVSYPSHKYSPVIHEKKVVWTDMRNGFGDIYMYDMDTQQERQITFNDKTQDYPDIYGDKIVWLDGRDGNDEIYMFDLTENKEIRITNDSYKQNPSRISGNKMVWSEGGNIYLYDILSKQKTKITSGGSNGGYWPDIYNNTIVWHDLRDSTAQVYMYILDTKPQSRLDNLEDSPITGTLTMILQKNVSGIWQNQRVVVNKTVIVPANGLLKLDNEWNPQNVVANSAGDYRVYAKFEIGGRIIDTHWEFKVS